MIRYHARWVLPITRAPIEHGTVVESGGRIAFVGTRDAAPAGIDVELGDAVLLPGLVNAHTHLELTAMRGLLEGLSFRDWIVRLRRAKAAVLDDAAMLDSARHGIVEGLSAGITTYGDTCDSGVSLRAMREAGVRGIMYQEVFGPAPEQCERSLHALREKLRATRARETLLQRVGVSPHAPYTVSDQLFAAVGRLAVEDRLPVAIHIAESEAESRYVGSGTGPFADGLRARGIPVAPRARSPVALLERLGLLAAAPLLIHCVRIDAEDIALIASFGCPVAHCPVSNAKLGHGTAPLVEMLGVGITVGLGSDSVASNNRMDMLAEARMAVLAQRLRATARDALPAARALELATLGGARALGVADRVGSLEPDKEADLAAFRIDVPRGVPHQDPETALVHALDGAPASLVVVAGHVLVRDARLRSADPDLPARVSASARALADWVRAHPEV